MVTDHWSSILYLIPILELKSLLTHLLSPHASRSLGVPCSNDATRQGSVRFYRLPINPLAGWSTPWAKRILASTYFRCRPGFCKSTPNHEPKDPFSDRATAVRSLNADTAADRAVRGYHCHIENRWEREGPGDERNKSVCKKRARATGTLSVPLADRHQLPLWFSSYFPWISMVWVSGSWWRACYCYIPDQVYL